VLYFSIHRDGAYPYTGAADEVGEGVGRGFTVNIPIDRRVGDRDYARILAGVLDPIARQYQPDLLLVSCGFDLHHQDPLGQLSLTAEGYRLITDIIIRIAQDVCGGKLALVLEGGYSVDGIKEAGSRVIRRLAGLDAAEPDVIRRLRDAGASGVPGLKKVLEVQREFWDL
jgi:acetoin utilization deacetylase AcuC-like enzyme